MRAIRSCVLRRVACHTRFFHEKVPASPLDIHKSVWSTQYLSIRDTERLTHAGIEPSPLAAVTMRTINVLAETVIGVFHPHDS